MPLKKGSSNKTISRNIKEIHKGQTYAKTAREFGKTKADKQAVAIAFSQAKRNKNKKIAKAMTNKKR